MVCIIVNTILLASRNYRGNYDRSFTSEWNNVIDTTDFGLTFVYLIECALKVIMMGLIKHNNAYLRDAWNRLDFFIVFVSLFNFIPGMD